MLYTQKYTPPFCFFYHFTGWVTFLFSNFFFIGQMIFIKVHAPFRVLAKAAIKTKMKFPVQKSDIGGSEATTQAGCSPCSSTIAGHFEISAPLTSTEERYFVDSFDHLKEKDKFIHTTKEEDFFTATERHRLVYHIIKSTRFVKFVFPCYRFMEFSSCLLQRRSEHGRVSK